MYYGQGITLESAGSWRFDNDTATNVIMFGVDNSSSSYFDNCKNNFLVVDEGPTLGINGSFCSLEKKFSINFSKESPNFCLSLHHNANNSYLFVNVNSLKLKPTIKMLIFQLNCESEVYLMNLVLMSLEKYFYVNAHDF